MDYINSFLADAARNDVVAVFTQTSPLPYATEATLGAYMFAIMNAQFMAPLDVVSNWGRVLVHAFGGLSICLPVLLGTFGTNADIYVNLDFYTHIFFAVSAAKLVLDAALSAPMKKVVNQLATIAYIIVLSNICVSATTTAAGHFNTTATGAWNVAGVAVPSIPISFGPWILGFVTVIAPRVLEEGIVASVQKAKSADWDHDYMLAVCGPVLVQLLSSQGVAENSVRLLVVAFRLSMLSVKVDYNEVFTYVKTMHSNALRRGVKLAKGRLSM